MAELKSIPVSLVLFNSIYRRVLFAFKTFLVVLPVTQMSFLFFFHFRYPALSAVCTLGGPCLAIAYPLVYHNAFGFSGQMAEIKKHLDMAAHRTSDLLEYQVIKRQIRSVPSTGILVGNVHYVERDSALVHVDLLVNLLCTVMLSSSF